ncbi:MAG: hypothetical protein MI974_13405 [Chitinophagales bacterium]|nr:hypothetical protein [Chitinophagales bacterium]
MYSGWSPYNYVKGNQILHTDPTGRSVEGEYERDEDGNWQKVSTVGDDIRVDFYHEDATASNPQTTYVTDRQGNWNMITTLLVVSAARSIPPSVRMGRGYGKRSECFIKIPCP